MPAVKKPSRAKTPAKKPTVAGRVAQPPVDGRADVIVDNQGQPIRVSDIPKTTRLETLDAYGTTHTVTIVLNGSAFELDGQQVLALQGQLAGLAVNLTY